jgi:hypothetical protein
VLGKPCGICHSHVGAFAVCARPPKHSGLCCPLDPPCATCVQPPALVCARCGEKPTGLEARTVARLGGTHSKKLTHAAGVPGREQGGKFRPCGPWVRAGAAADEAARALEAWREARAEEVHR